MLAVNDPAFLDFWSRLLQDPTMIPEFERLVDDGLNLQEKVREYISDGGYYWNKSLLFLALALSESTELVHFLVCRCIPDEEDVELCVNLHSQECRAWLEEMLKRYDGKLDYWMCRDHLELFLGYQIVNLEEEEVGRHFWGGIPLLPIEHQIARYLCGYGGMDGVLLLQQAESPPPRVGVVRQVVDYWISYRSISVFGQRDIEARLEKVLLEVK